MVLQIIGMKLRRHLLKKRNNLRTLLIFETDGSSYYEIFKKHISENEYMQLCCLSDTAPESRTDADVELGYRTLQDYFHAFPNYTRQDILRLYAMTGGIYSVSKRLDRNLSYEENMRSLLAYDSVFSTFLPNQLTECFRKPESYYPIFKSISSGHHRLSEIANDIEFLNNKCGKYLETLIKNNFVVAKKALGGKQATYYFANPYFQAWTLYVCGKKSMQLTKQDLLCQYVTESVDTDLALPVFYDACQRFIQKAPKDYLIRYRDAKIVSTEKSVSVEIGDDSEVMLDYCVQTDDELFVFIFPKSVDMCYTKTEIQNIYTALKLRDMYYNTHIIIFSVRCFSDWCVH